MWNRSPVPEFRLRELHRRSVVPCVWGGALRTTAKGRRADLAQATVDEKAGCDMPNKQTLPCSEGRLAATMVPVVECAVCEVVLPAAVTQQLGYGMFVGLSTAGTEVPSRPNTTSDFGMAMLAAKAGTSSRCQHAGMLGKSPCVAMEWNLRASACLGGGRSCTHLQDATGRALRLAQASGAWEDVLACPSCPQRLAQHIIGMCPHLVQTCSRRLGATQNEAGHCVVAPCRLV